MIDKAIKLLLSAQNSDGGWGAGMALRSNTESTSFAVLGLTAVRSDALVGYIDKGARWLASSQNNDGSWPRSADVTGPSWSTANAVLALSQFASYREAARKGADWLVATEGSPIPLLASLLLRFSIKKRVNRLDDSLIGWPWVSGTFSWVEPTSYALIALKKMRPFLEGGKAEDRIKQGELMIYDRMCEGGGWNYGNSKVYGETLWPYPDITALALIALQDHAKADANQKSLEALNKMLPAVNSGLALSWSILCFSLYDHHVAEWRKLLTKRFEETNFLGESKSIALSLLAQGEGPRLFEV